MFAFDLLRLKGEDLRPLPLEERRARLRVKGGGEALRLSEHLLSDGPEIYRHACALALEASYRSGETAATGLAAVSRG